MVYFNNRSKNITNIPYYICQRKDIAVMTGASASTAALTGQNSSDKVAQHVRREWSSVCIHIYLFSCIGKLA